MAEGQANGSSKIEQIENALAQMAATQADMQLRGLEHHIELQEARGVLATVIASQQETNDQLRQLLTAQVVLTDRVNKLAVRFDELAVSQRNADDRMSALIGVVDDLIRHTPPS